MAEALAGDIPVKQLVDALFTRALMLNRYKVRAAMAGYLELLCEKCGEDDQPYGHVIWSTENRGRQNYTLVEIDNLANAHEQMSHKGEAAG